MGKRKYSAEEVIAAVRANKGILTLAAKSLGCTRQTVHNYVNNYATVKDAVDEERDSLIDMAEAKLFDQVRQGNMTAIIFTLKTIGKHRGYVERQELAHDGDVKIRVVYGDDGTDS